MFRSRKNRIFRGLSVLGDGYICAEIDDYLESYGVTMDSMPAHVVGPLGYVDRLSVGYPIPAEISHDVPFKEETKYIRLKLTEVWLEYVKDKLHAFAVYELRGRYPTVNIKIDH